jgi:hypothetical protein
MWILISIAIVGTDQTRLNIVSDQIKKTLGGHAWAHAFQCDGIIDMIEDFSVAPCGFTTEEIHGLTPMEE